MPPLIKGIRQMLTITIIRIFFDVEKKSLQILNVKKTL